MNFDNCLSHQTPPQQTSCLRQNAWLDKKSGRTLPKDARRSRQELRRTRSVPAKSDAGSSSSSDSDVCLKKKRDEIQNKTIEGSSSDLAPEEDAAVIGVSVASVRSRPYGKISVVGRRREMEDFVVVELGFLKRGMESYDFFGVFDGPGGWRVAHACGQVLHKILAKIAGEDSGEELDWEAVMAAGFNMMEAELNNMGEAPVSMLASAVVVVVGKHELVVANHGGSRVVLSSGGVAVQLLEDHKIEDLEGDDLMSNAQLQPDRSEAAINCTASTAIVPKVRVMMRRQTDEFLILGSHGLWDVISDESACQVASSFCGPSNGSGAGGAVAAAAFMAELAVARGSKDNISIIVLDLQEEENLE